MRRILAVAAVFLPLAAGAEPAGITVAGPSTGPTFTLTSVSHLLTGQVVTERGRREQVLVSIRVVTEETIGEKGISGEVEITGRPAEADAPPLYTTRLSGRAAVLEDGGLIAVDQDDCCALFRAYLSPATGRVLFQSTVPPARLDLEGMSYRRRIAAYTAALDDQPEHRAWGDKAVGLLTYAAADRVVSRILIEAADARTARRLRSIDDERAALAWVDMRTGAPLASVPAGGGVRPALRLHFMTSGIEVLVPLEEDRLVAGLAPANLKLTARREAPLQGGWRVAEARAAPWSKATGANAFANRFILFGTDTVRAAGTVLDCGKAEYAEALVPPEGLFMGAGLSAAQAAALGFAAGLSTSVTLTCDSGVFTLHRTGEGRYLFALDNVLYALERAVE